MLDNRGQWLKWWKAQWDAQESEPREFLFGRVMALQGLLAAGLTLLHAAVPPETLKQLRNHDSMREVIAMVNGIHTSALANWDDDISAGFSQEVAEIEDLLVNPPSAPAS